MFQTQVAEKINKSKHTLCSVTFC